MIFLYYRSMKKQMKMNTTSCHIKCRKPFCENSELHHVSELLTCIFLCLADYWRPDHREGDNATEVRKGTGQPETADGGASERNHQHPGRKAGSSREAAQRGTWQRQKGCCWSISTDKTGKAASRFVLSLCVKFIPWLPQVCGRFYCESLIISLINLF